MKKDTMDRFTRNMALNGILIYILLSYFNYIGKMKSSNLKFVFPILGLYFLVNTYKFFKERYIQNKPFKSDKIILLMATFNVLLYILASFGIYYGNLVG